LHVTYFLGAIYRLAREVSGGHEDDQPDGGRLAEMSLCGNSGAFSEVLRPEMLALGKGRVRRGR
jgi:hypothetical protein